MQRLDLTDYGFPGKVFAYHGKIERDSKQGNKLLFLFKEKHEKEPIIRPNVWNALNLIDQQVISCIGVEEHPFVYAGKTADEMGELYKRALAQFGSEEGILAALGPKYFGRAVKLLRATVPVGCVEDGGLYDIAHKKDDEYREKAEKLEGAYYKEMALEKYGGDWNAISPAETQPLSRAAKAKALAAVEEEYGNDPVNRSRDLPFLTNMMALWQAAGYEKAAILNAGSKHIERIVTQYLPAEIRYVQLTQE